MHADDGMCHAVERQGAAKGVGGAPPSSRVPEFVAHDRGRAARRAIVGVRKAAADRGATPRTWKKFAVTRWPVSRSGRSPPGQRQSALCATGQRLERPLRARASRGNSATRPTCCCRSWTLSFTYDQAIRVGNGSGCSRMPVYQREDRRRRADAERERREDERG